LPLMATAPRHSSLTKLGQQKDGTYLSYEASTGETPANALTLKLNAKKDSTLDLNFKKLQKEIDVKMDVSGSDALVMKINDSKPGASGATITIMHDGNVKIQTSDNAKILLGGQNKEQRLVTEKFVKDIYEKHMHSNGNQGAPTGKPILPPIIDLNMDSNTAPYTFTTKAE
jgi:hypothetical protein